MKFDIILGNPPYGIAANMAVKFLNKACELSDDVRMILPASFVKDSIINRVHPGFRLAEEVRLPDDTFPRSITTVKQRWVRGESRRDVNKIYRSHPDFEFLRYEDRAQADVFIGCVGCGPAGKVKTSNFVHYSPNHFFLKCDETIKQRLVSLEPEFIKDSRVCGCLPGISKHDIIRVYMDNYG